MWRVQCWRRVTRGRIKEFDYTEAGKKVDAISVAWAGGKEGKGSKLLLWILGDEYNLIKPAFRLTHQVVQKSEPGHSRHFGRDYRLTDVYGEVLQNILA